MDWHIITSLPAIASVVAVAITGLLSFAAMTLTKEQKVSEFRQNWIDNLRKDLSAFFASAQAFARATAVRNRNLPSNPSRRRFGMLQALFRNASKSEAWHADEQQPFSEDKLAELRINAVTAYYSIKLRLNGKEKEHSELLQMLDAAIFRQNAMYDAGNPDPTDVLESLQAASDAARPLLKKEWNRVKRGEIKFLVVQYGALALFCLLLTGFWVVLDEHVFKAKSSALNDPSSQPFSKEHTESVASEQKTAK